MPERPKILDLFCCEGGAAEGYRRAGFDVYGVDNDPAVAKRYPFPIHIGDALDVLARLIAGEAIDFTHRDGSIEWLTLADFVAAHASPPCQAYSITKNAHSAEHPELVEPTRALLIETGLPYVIENVEGAPLIDPLTLCGTEFGLIAADVDGQRLALRRHRLFESNVWLIGPGGCIHDRTIVGGVYSGSRNRTPEHRDRKRKGGYTPAVSVRAELMRADWMSEHGLSQAIPPAFSEWIGLQLIEHMSAVSA